MSLTNIIIVMLFAFLVICFIVEAIDDKRKEKYFKDNIKIGTKLYLIYFNFDNNFVEKIFKAEVIEIVGENQVVIKYSDGSTEHNYITGFVSLYSNGWRIEK